MSRIKTYRPWQLRQWLGLGADNKPKPNPLPANLQQLQTRQRKRAAFRALSHKQITKQYGPEPRHARRNIALVLARKAFQEHQKSA